LIRRILRLFRNRPQLAGTVFLPLFWALYTAYRVLLGKRFILSGFVDRPVSIASFDGVDVAERVRTFYLGIGLAVVVFIALLLLLQFLLPLVRKAEQQLMQASSAAGIILLFFTLTGADMRSGIHLLAALQGATVAGIISRRLMKAQLSDEAFLFVSGWLGVLGVSLGIVARTLLPASLPLPSLPEAVFVTGCVGWSLVYYRLKAPRSDANLVMGLIRRTSGWVIAPLLLVVAAELRMILGMESKAPVWVALSLIAASVFLPRRGPGSLHFLQERFFNRTLPLFLAGVLAYAYYRPVVEATIDVFEDANRILPLLQWHSFGKVPFLDSFSSHALSDWCWGALYNLFNGFDVYGTYVYGFLLHILIALTTYWLAWKVWNNGWLALFLALFYPYTHLLVPAYYHFVPVTVVLLLPIADHPSRKHFVRLFSWVFFLMVWRLDVGLSNTLATFALVMLLGFTGQVKPFFTTALRGLMMAAIPWLVLVGAALLLRGGALFTRLREILAYTDSYQSYGLRTLGTENGLLAQLQYYALPLAVLIVLGTALLRPRRHRPTVLAMAFFTAFFLVNLQRGLVRHSLAEGWDAAWTSYGFFVLAASVYATGKTRSISRFFSFSIASTLIILFLKFDRPAADTNSRYAQVAERSFTGIDLYPPQAARVTVPAGQTAIASELKDVLDQEFGDSATFLDFSNTPMLYAFTGRSVPNYFCQIPHTAHNGFLQERFLEELKQYDVPLVVFAHHPEGFWDALDGIPNAARHYRIAEYLYAKYRPAWLLGQHTVWLRKDIALPEQKESALLWRTDWTRCRITEGYRTDSLTLHESGGGILIEDLLPAGGGRLTTGKRYYFRLEGYAEGSGVAELHVKTKDPDEVRVVKWPLQWGRNTCFFPFDLPEGASGLEQLQLRLPVQTFRLSTMALMETDRLPDRVSGAYRYWDLGYIPYYWGTYDAGVITRELELGGSRSLAADEEFRLPLPEPGAQATYLDLDAGTAGDQPVTLIVSYGRADTKLGAFSLRLKPGEIARYRIRALSQFNWYSAKPDWVALYPAGKEVQLRRLSLAFGE
jgi:hypothetical protein